MRRWRAAMQADRLGDAAGFIERVIAAHPGDMPMISTLANILRQRTPHEPGDLVGGVLRTRTRPSLNRRTESAPLYEHSPSR